MTDVSPVATRPRDLPSAGSRAAARRARPCQRRGRSPGAHRPGPLAALAALLALGWATPAGGQEAWPNDDYFGEERWRPNESPGAEPGLYLFVCARGEGASEADARDAALRAVRRRVAEKRAQALAEAAVRFGGPAGAARLDGPGETADPARAAAREFVRADDAWFVRRTGRGGARAVEAFVRAGYPEAWVRPHRRLLALQDDWPELGPGASGPAPGDPGPGGPARTAWFERAAALVATYEAEGELALAALTAELAASRPGAPVSAALGAAGLHERAGRTDDAARVLEAARARPGLAPADLAELALRVAGLHERAGKPDAAARALVDALAALPPDPAPPAGQPEDRPGGQAGAGPGLRARVQAALDRLAATWDALGRELLAWVERRPGPPAFRVEHALRAGALELQVVGADDRRVVWLWLDDDGLYRYHVLAPGQRGLLRTPPLAPGTRARLVAVALPPGAAPAWLDGPGELVVRAQVDARDPRAARAYRAVLALEGAWAATFTVAVP